MSVVVEATNSESMGFAENRMVDSPGILRVVKAEIAETVSVKVNGLTLDVKQKVLGQPGATLVIDGVERKKWRKIVLVGEVGKPWTAEIHEFLI